MKNVTKNVQTQITKKRTTPPPLRQHRNALVPHHPQHTPRTNYQLHNRHSLQQHPTTTYPETFANGKWRKSARDHVPRAGGRCRSGTAPYTWSTRAREKPIGRQTRGLETLKSRGANISMRSELPLAANSPVPETRNHDGIFPFFIYYLRPFSPAVHLNN